MELFKLDDYLKDEPAYRRQQVWQAIFKDLISGWQEATTLPLTLREKLAGQFPLQIRAAIVGEKSSRKAIIVLADGARIESVLIRHRDGRNTVCVSSQAGCAMGCKFCATGAMGFVRNLSIEEIVFQVLLFARLLKKEGERVSNVVVMGMGEPFLNYDAVLRAIRILRDPEGFNLGARHFSISTVGITSGIDRLSKENLQVNLAVSLHAPNNELRASLMPIGKTYPIEKIIKSIDQYIARTKRRVMFEYVMIDKVNDTDANAKQLAILMKNPLYFVNLIRYNETNRFSPSPENQLKNFKRLLEEAGVAVTVRHSFGNEFQGACGQLATSEGDSPEFKIF